MAASRVLDGAGQALCLVKIIGHVLGDTEQGVEVYQVSVPVQGNIHTVTPVRPASGWVPHRKNTRHSHHDFFLPVLGCDELDRSSVSK